MICQKESSVAVKKYECELCEDQEWILDKETNTAMPCKCREVKRYRRILENSGISESFQKKTLNNFITKGRPQIVQQAKATVIEFLRDFENENSIALIGTVGCGKTHLGAAIANELMEKGIGVLYENYRDMINKLKQSVLDEENYNREMNKYKNATVLFIDDLFKEILNADIKYIYEVVNYRYFNGKRMIITSERKTMEWLRIDSAVGSRLYEMCKGRIVEFAGKGLNYRLRQEA